MSRTRYFVRRTVTTAVLIFIVASAMFFLFRFMPGDFTVVIAQTGASPEELAQLRAKFGLNAPLYVQYWKYITQLAVGNMGTSFRLGEPVLEITGTRILNSFVLVAPAIIVAYILGSIYGAIMGTNVGKPIERYGIVGVTILGTLPEFFTGILLIIVFASWLNLLPTGGMLGIESYRTLGSNYSQFEIYMTPGFWLHYLLPFTVIVMRYIYFPSLVMRTGIVEVLNQDYVYFQRISGLSRGTRIRNIMKHASLPVITMFPASITRAIGGMVVVETVFNWPGIGQLLVKSVLFRDYPVVQFVFFLVAVWVIIGNYIVDILYTIIDPRVSIESEPN